MSEPDWVKTAEAAGLAIALKDHYADVAAAAASAASAAKGVTPPADPRAEPWPPMRVGPAL